MQGYTGNTTLETDDHYVVDEANEPGIVEKS